MLISISGIRQHLVAANGRPPALPPARGGILQHHRCSGERQNQKQAANLWRRPVQREQRVSPRSRVSRSTQCVQRTANRLALGGDGNKVLFKALLPRPTKPDAYLVAMTAEQSGGIHTHQSGTWLHSDARLISFSEHADHQELLIVMPPFTWIRGGLGAFFLVSGDAQKSWKARLVLSAKV